MDVEFIRKRITELRVARDVSEYKISTDLGFSKGYIQSITSGRSLPSLQALLDLCDYFHISPREFFDEDVLPESPLVLQILQNLRELSDEDLTTILEVTEKYRYYRHQKRRMSGALKGKNLPRL